MSKALTQRKLEFLICMLLTWKTGHSICIADQRESRNKNILLLEHIRTKLVGDYTRFKNSQWTTTAKLFRRDGNVNEMITKRSEE